MKPLMEDNKRTIGLDIGGTKCAAVLGFAGGGTMEIREKERFDTPAGNPGAVLGRFENFIRAHAGGLAGIGISCGGPLDAERGVILSPPNLPGWDGIEIVRYFAERFRVPVRLQNDANACALAEWKYGAGRGLRNLVFLTFGTGLGAGLILDGKLYSGTGGLAGEIGHWRMEEDGPVGFGKSGSLEGFCSGGGLAQLARSADPDRRNITAKRAAELADGGDEAMRGVYARSGYVLGRALALILDFLDPEMVILGSIFARSGHLLWPYAKEVLEQ
ncbi:MAG: ROK family protein, partial [Oscillospiraceae bacterium]|nr:ROK family protein [Oscillospiraceae bacterium]